jgi:predicted lipid-binding transport protein (Tim44 family)
VATGELDWIVRSANVVKREERPPMLTADVEERGTDLATVVDPGAKAHLSAIGQRDSNFSWQAFQQRLTLIFDEFQKAWSQRDLAPMRGFLSDNLFQMQGYWTQAYKKQGLRNVSERTRVVGIELARVESDASYDAITVRVRAIGLDYTIADTDGRVVCGSRTKERSYTEYWTLIRGAATRAPTRTEAVCPNCGAPLQINMAGVCGYCNAKVTSGEFDWVLSRIEQDEVYAG